MSEEEGEDWEADFEGTERRQFRTAMSLSAEQRLQWVEDMIRFARRYARKGHDDAER